MENFFQIIYHALGLCSDSSTHPSLLTLLMSGGVGIGVIWTWFKSKFSKHNHDENCDCKSK